MATRGGLVMLSDQGLRFIPADVAQNLVPEPEISDVPGTGVGMALVGGEVLPVLPLGSRPGAVVVCEVRGERIAFSGLSPEAAGFFEAVSGGVRVGDELVPELDLGEIRTSVEKRLQGARGGGA
jgi:hypothetical protein